MSSDASGAINGLLNTNKGDNFFDFEVTLFLNDVDFLLLLGAAGVLYQDRLKS